MKKTQLCFRLALKEDNDGPLLKGDFPLISQKRKTIFTQIRCLMPLIPALREAELGDL